MSRLFTSTRDIKFISDITKEIVKDVAGQKIYYYPISELKTLTHDVYQEAVKKVYDKPIIIDALVDAQYQSETKMNRFGPDAQFKLDVYVQYRDLIEKSINVTIGDYFSHGEIFYEIVDKVIENVIHGMPEHKRSVKISGVLARKSLFDAPLNGPTDISNTDVDAVQENFYQQRGVSENADGQTGDVRELVRDGVLEEPLTGPREVSERGDPNEKGSSFYGDV